MTARRIIANDDAAVIAGMAADRRFMFMAIYFEHAVAAVINARRTVTLAFPYHPPRPESLRTSSSPRRRSRTCAPTAARSPRQ